MKLWILRPIGISHPCWEPWYDKSFGFVIRAETSKRARIIASERSGDERPEAWLKEMNSTCIELSQDGPEEEIMCDFNAA